MLCWFLPFDSVSQPQVYIYPPLLKLPPTPTPSRCSKSSHCKDRLFCLSMHPLRYVWIVSTFWLLQIVLFGTFMYRFLCEYTFSFLLGEELLGVTEAPHLII